MVNSPATAATTTTTASSGASALSRFAFPVFRPDGDVDVRYANQQHVRRKRHVASYLLVFALVYAALEVPYILHPEWTASRDYVPLILRGINALVLYAGVAANRRLYVARFVTHTTERFDALVCALLVVSAVLVCAMETQRHNHDWVTSSIDASGTVTFTTHRASMDDILQEGLLLELTLIYAFACGLARLGWIWISTLGGCSIVAYIVTILVADERSTRRLLLGLAYQAVIVCALIGYAWLAEQARSETLARQKHQYAERKKAEQLLRSMLPVRILSDYLDGSIGQLQANATIGFVQMHLGALASDQSGPASPQSIASPGELMQKLHDTFKRIDGIVSMYAIRGVAKIETVATTYLLCAGLLQDIDDHAAAMIDVSLEIMSMVTTRLNLGGGTKKRIPVLLRIGISSGPVVGGIIGAQRRFFRVFGDTVNVAARMCTNVSMGCIQISPSCFAALSDRQRAAYKIPPGETLAIKGKGAMTCYRVESRADWVPKFGKSTMNRGGQDRDVPLLNKSFVYHDLMAHTELAAWTLRYKQERGLGRLARQATFVRVARTSSAHGAAALTQSPFSKAVGSIRGISSRMLAPASVETARAQSPVPAENAGTVHPTATGDPAALARVASASRSRVRPRFSAAATRARDAAALAAAAADAEAAAQRVSPFCSSSIERFFQLSYARHQLLSIRVSTLYVAFFAAGILIYLGVHHPRASDTEDWSDSVENLSPIVFVGAALMLCLLFTGFSALNACCRALIVCKSRDGATVDAEMLNSANSGSSSSDLGGERAADTVARPDHFARNLQTYSVIFCALLYAWSLVALDLWGVGSAQLSPVFAAQLITIYSCFLLRLQFRLVAPLACAAWLSFGGILLAGHYSYVHLLLILSHLFVGLVIGLVVAYEFERAQRGNFLLAYALEKEQESMDQFLNNLLPKDVVLVLKKQNPALAKEVVRGPGGRAGRRHGSRTSTTVPAMSIGEGGVASRFAMHFPRTTVFESDIVGYTQLVSFMSPADTLDLLNRLFSRFDRAARDCGVEKIETIGDAFMCMVFDGAPDPVLDFALRIVDELRDANREMRHKNDLQIRMGISTGSCFGGIVGTAVPRFHLFGACHDVAIHIEQNGRPGDIIVSSSTHALSAARYEYQPLALVVDDLDTFLLREKKPEDEWEDEEEEEEAAVESHYVSIAPEDEAARLRRPVVSPPSASSAAESALHHERLELALSHARSASGGIECTVNASTPASVTAGRLSTAAGRSVTEPESTANGTAPSASNGSLIGHRSHPSDGGSIGTSNSSASGSGKSRSLAGPPTHAPPTHTQAAAIHTSRSAVATAPQEVQRPIIAQSQFIDPNQVE